MNDAAKSQDVNQAAALRGEPEAAGHGSVEGDVRALRQMVADCDVYLKEGETPAQRIDRERRDTEAVLNLLIREKQRTEAMREVMLRMMAGIDHLAEIARQWEPDYSSGADRRGWVLAKDARDDAARLIPETHQAASGCSHTARSDGQEMFPRCTEKLRAAGKAYPRTCAECGLGPCRAAKSVEQEATPPAPAAPASALSSKRSLTEWRRIYDTKPDDILRGHHFTEFTYIGRYFEALAASPQPAVPTVKRDYCPEKLKPGGCQLHNLHCGYPACNAAPAAEGSAS